MQKIFRYIQKYDMIRPGDRVLAGVSGGADSVCLLLALLEYRKQMDFSVSVVHVEHGIRGEESRRDADFVRGLCNRWEVPFRLVPFDIPAMARARGQSLEETARQARYQAFEEVRQELGADRIAVAHNRRDQAETMLWHMARGCGLDGACGIWPVRGRIIRPLLDCDRREIEGWLLERGIFWREDSTNQDTIYTRNYIRKELLPLMETGLNAGTVRHLAMLAEEFRQTQEYLEAQVREAAKRILRREKTEEMCPSARSEQPGNREQEAENFRKETTIGIAIPEFQKEPSFLRERIIRYALTLAGCGGRDVTRKHIGEICALTRGQSGRKVTLPGGWTAWREFDRIRIGQRVTPDRALAWEAVPDNGSGENAGQKTSQGRERGESSAEPGTPLQIPGVTCTPFGTFETKIFFHENQEIPEKKYTKWLNYDKMSSVEAKRRLMTCAPSGASLDKIRSIIQIRTRRPGDYLVINREGGRKKLKTYLMEEKIPVQDRDRLGLVACGQEILWIPGHRISEAWKVRPDTERILEIRFILPDCLETETLTASDMEK